MTKQEKLTKLIEIADVKYSTTPMGKVLNRKSGRELKPALDKSGYQYISVYIGNGKSKKVKVHRLVAYQQIPNHNNYKYVNHKDGVRDNNCVINLEWCDMSYNVSDGFKRGRIIWNKDKMSKERALFLIKKYPRQTFWILRQNDFAAAKAIWGEVEYEYASNGERCDYKNKGWKHHLQQAVISDDPLEYYWDNK